MNLFSILAHLSLLIHAGKDVQSIAQNLIQHRENFPSNTEFANLIDDAVAIIGSGLFAFPADVVSKMVDSLNQLKNDLSAGLPSPAPTPQPAHP